MKQKLEKMKNDYDYKNFTEKELQEVMENYDALIKATGCEDDSFLKDYQWNIENNQIKPANIVRKLLIPHWDKIAKMVETKAILKLLER